ncbi:MAG: hypothetical protein HY329_17855 [Chloroflexi bacterium]|nr:hypothetical protein [Chloroflexota bacterium]
MELPEFERLLRSGHGRPLLFLRDHDATPYRDAILHACLHDLRYDGQVEEPRGNYLFELLQLTGEPDWYRARLIAALQQATKVNDKEQLVDLVYSFAKQGDAEARNALYESFTPRRVVHEHYSEVDVAGAEQLVDLEGEAGLLFVMDRIGGGILDDPEWDEDEFLLDFARKRLGGEVVRAVVAEASASSPRILAYVQAVKRTTLDREKYRAQAKLRSETGSVPYERVQQWLRGEIDAF